MLIGENRSDRHGLAGWFGHRTPGQPSLSRLRQLVRTEVVCVGRMLRRIRISRLSCQEAIDARLVTLCYNGGFVIELTLSLLAAIRVFLRNRADTALEILASRQQVAVLKRRHPRPKLNAVDRVF